MGVALNITAYVESPDHVCCRYRIAPLLPFLASAGFSLTFRSTSSTRWFQGNADWESGEIAIVQRWLPSALDLWRLRRRHRYLIFDFDDAVWLRDSYSAQGMHSAKRLRRFRRIISASDLVVAGNDFLAAQAARFIDSDRVRIVPTCVDFRKYPLAAHERRRTIDLVWIGSSSTLKGLEQIRALLEAVGKAVPNVRLRLVCDRFLSFDHLPTTGVNWNESTEAAELADADIGIAWMPDDDWSRGKCGLKVVQYMAAGLPVVANPVGVHSTMVEHGVTGFLAEASVDWIEAVALLSRHSKLRRWMGGAGRKRVESEYSVARAGERWLSLLESLLKMRIAA